MDELLTAAAVLITAITGLLAVLLVQVRKVKIEAAQAAAETTGTLRKVESRQNDIHAQVQNHHGSNLRDDVDRLTDLVNNTNALSKQTNRQLTVLFAELREERKRLTRVDNDAHDTHTEIFNRLREIEKGPEK